MFLRLRDDPVPASSTATPLRAVVFEGASPATPACMPCGNCTARRTGAGPTVSNGWADSSSQHRRVFSPASRSTLAPRVGRARVLRPRHGRGGGRNRRDRRRLHDLPGRYARRHFALVKGTKRHPDAGSKDVVIGERRRQVCSVVLSWATGAKIGSRRGGDQGRCQPAPRRWASRHASSRGAEPMREREDVTDPNGLLRPTASRQEDDPLSQAMKRPDRHHASSQDHQIALLWKRDREAVSVESQ